MTLEKLSKQIEELKEALKLDISKEAKRFILEEIERKENQLRLLIPFHVT